MSLVNMKSREAAHLPPLLNDTRTREQIEKAGDDYWPNGRLYTPPGQDPGKFWPENKPTFMSPEAMEHRDRTAAQAVTPPPQATAAAPVTLPDAPMESESGELDEVPREIRQYTYGNRTLTVLDPIVRNVPREFIGEGVASVDVMPGKPPLPLKFNFPISVSGKVPTGDGGTVRDATLQEEVAEAFARYDEEADTFSRTKEFREYVANVRKQALSRLGPAKPGLVDAAGFPVSVGGKKKPAIIQ